MIAAGAGSLILASSFGGDEKLYNVEAWQKTYMIMALAERLNIPMTIYDGELEDETDEEMLFGTALTDAKLKRLKKSKFANDIIVATSNIKSNKPLLDFLKRTLL